MICCMCDEQDDKVYCENDWPQAGCEEIHNEGCMTSIMED